MTNYEYIRTLPNEQRIEVQKTYARHPLAKYIDWRAFFQSENGNEIDFVRFIRKETDELDRVVYTLEESIIDGIMYAKIYNGDDVMLVPCEEG